MNIDLYQVDAFTNKIFGGNPAAVCPLNTWLEDNLMLKIAEENNLAETVFFVKKDNLYEIRWFMPYAEIDLCGHATLAAAYIIFNFLDKSLNEIIFSSKSGILKVFKKENNLIQLDFPSRPVTKIDIPKEVFSAFKIKPLEAYFSRDLILFFDNEDKIKQLKPTLHFLKNLPYLCIVATAKSNQPNIDFVSRVFDANGPHPEDPVTGSAHTSLIPFWKDKLNKSYFNALQLSARKGFLLCGIKKDRVQISGNAVLFLKGQIYLP